MMKNVSGKKCGCVRESKHCQCSKILRNRDPGNPQIVAFERKSTGGGWQGIQNGQKCQNIKGEVFKMKNACMRLFTFGFVKILSNFSAYPARKLHALALKLSHVI